MPKCSQCYTWKGDDDFYRRSTGKLRRDCKRCMGDRTKMRRFANRVNNPVQFRHKSLRSTLEQKYGISPEDRDRLEQIQEGRCLLCDKGGNLCVDHNHRTGKVRGLLCKRCNMILGIAEADPILFLKIWDFADKTLLWGNGVLPETLLAGDADILLEVR